MKLLQLISDEAIPFDKGNEGIIPSRSIRVF